MPQGQRAEIDWREGGVPVSVRFDDPYFSIADGLAETRHVFLAGNGLPGRFVPGFHIAELGFGTGLNLLATLIAWRAAGVPGPLRFTSFEAFPMAPEAMDRALRAFPEARAVADPLIAAWAEGARRIETDDLHAEIVEGDARETLPRWPGRADAWFLDGFSPAKNPELWSPELMAEVARHTAPNGTAATYTAAGFVRRGLTEAGFEVTRQPGFGRKRHMTTARLR
ncbi:tRNA (5-methylaminomethyl-2-thiouridine)(34)-methyltransferase MnmD [Rhodovulum visakhapatnamense]|uniref:tRNA (5-methylaminomethyl-2-thiouridine)(34)-methyltransferase MnmD n=1 Tax=Rhodovulum visakhapatnamense TaxID=364297 RepID=UPI0014170B04|nr:tRNA (5-methylaminomethyl-2-thiouridine)(34)-methyltransferase MnmD [Rhodovulum visakhapatnamense]